MILIRPAGRLIVTVPFGQSYENDFHRSFSPDEIRDLIRGVELLDGRYFGREDHRFRRPITAREARTLSNREEDGGPTGVNAVGCFVGGRGSS